MNTQTNHIKAALVIILILFSVTPRLSAQNEYTSMVNPGTEHAVGMKVVDFKLEKNSEKIYLQMDMKNIGRSISKGAVYINLESENGKAALMLDPETFTALPGYSYQILFNLPEQITTGDYKAVGYFQFGDDEHYKAAEIGFAL